MKHGYNLKWINQNASTVAQSVKVKFIQFFTNLLSEYPITWSFFLQLLNMGWVKTEGFKPLSGNNSYIIHFEPGQTPPVDAFWSITMYDDEGLLVDNPLNRYLIGTYTEGLRNNTDGSLDIYLQNASPGADKESNWLPAPPGSFSLFLRMYLPQPQILNGTWQPPALELATG